MSKTKEMATVVKGDVAPSYINTDGGSRGNEEVGTDDLVIPRLELVQALSPCRKKTDPGYIKGAEEGMLYNSLTRELYGESVVLVPVAYRKELLCWKDRKKTSGGFRGSFSSHESAVARVAEGKAEDDLFIEIVETGQHLCMLVHPDGRVEEIALSMAKSKAKISKAWNSLIRINGGDRFSRAYEIKSVCDSNDNGDEYFNMAVKLAGFPSEMVYTAAEKLYTDMTSGDRNVTVSSEFDDSNDDEEEGTEY